MSALPGDIIYEFKNGKQYIYYTINCGFYLIKVSKDIYYFIEEIYKKTYQKNIKNKIPKITFQNTLPEIKYEYFCNTRQFFYIINYFI